MASGGYFKNGDSHLSPISHFPDAMWEVGCKFSWFQFLTSSFPFLISISHFWIPISHFSFLKSHLQFLIWSKDYTYFVQVITFGGVGNGKLEVGNGKWEIRNKKWEMGSRKWDVGIHNNVDTLEPEMRPRDMGNGTQMRTLIFIISSSAHSNILSIFQTIAVETYPICLSCRVEN